LDVIANMLLKSSTFIRSLQMHLYRSNINLKIDMPYSLPLPYYILCTVFYLAQKIISQRCKTLVCCSQNIET